MKSLKRLQCHGAERAEVQHFQAGFPSGYVHGNNKAIGEYVGKEFGHKIQMQVLYGKGARFAAPTFDASVTKQDEMKWSKGCDSMSRRKQSMMMRRQKFCHNTGPM
jgi:hypothetical protein